MLEVLGGARTTMLVEIRYVSGEACPKDSIDSLVCFWVCFGLGLWMVALETWYPKTRLNL